MKKLILLAVLVLSAMTASAQMMTSRTLMKRHTPTTWYVRAGLSVNMLTGMSSDDKDNGYKAGSKAGFEVDFGFNKPIGKSGTYWGMELGFNNRGGKITNKEYDNASLSLNAWAIKYSPFTFGYKYSVTDDLKIDAHLGLLASIDVSQSAKGDEDDYGSDAFENSFDIGLQVGVGAWYKKFNLDITYQPGFAPFVSTRNGDLKSSQVLIRLGYAF